MKKIIAVVAALSAVFSAPAFAAETPFYAGIDFGRATYKYTDTPNSVTSYGLLGGYSFNQNVAAELTYNDFGRASSNLGPATVRATAWGLKGVGILPLNKQFSVFAKLGIASVSSDVTLVTTTTTGKTDVTYGLGAQFNASEQIAIKAGIDVYKSKTGVVAANINNWNLGVATNF